FKSPSHGDKVLPAGAARLLRSARSVAARKSGAARAEYSRRANFGARAATSRGWRREFCVLDFAGHTVLFRAHHNRRQIHLRSRTAHRNRRALSLRAAPARRFETVV